MTRTASSIDGNLIYNIISRVEFNETGPFPSESFALANEWLVKIYPAEESMESTRKKVVKKLFLLTERIIVASPMSCCSSVVLSMSDALCLWIKDGSEALPDAEYNETVRYQRVIT
jgi:hypothetical protein